MTDYSFRILNVDLNTGMISHSEVASNELRAFLGGSSLGAQILFPQLRADLDPLSPEAPLLFLTGPLTGTIGTSVGRYVICAKSPATKLWGESNVGGYFGSELRSAGYDGLLISGCAADPVYLWIHDRQVDIRPADHLWGICDTYETQVRIKQELSDQLVRVACIGLAGENVLPIALILCDQGRVAGRTGMGAVMGSKNLKAIAVRGRQPIPIADPNRFKISRRRENINLRNDNYSRAAREVGTAGVMDYLHYLGDVPTHYYTRGIFKGVEKVSGTTVAETILTGVSTCHGCVIACGRVVRLEDGRDRKGPEYETIAGFGPNLGIDDISVITMLGDLCDRYGLDTISISNVIGLAFYLYMEGILTKTDTDGVPLIWGNADATECLVHQTVRREGLGGLLAQGSKALAEHFHVPETAAQVNGLEVAYHDPRGASGMALVYATSPRGACHNQSDYFMVDTFGHTMEEIGIGFHARQGGAEKAASVARLQDWRTLCNALVLCTFANVPPESVLELINDVTGFDFTLDEIIAIGERAWNLKRVINYRLGLTGENDRLPGHLLKPLPDGGSAGYVPPFSEMLAAYYQVRGWDPETGRPTLERLESLDLTDWISDNWTDKI